MKVFAPAQHPELRNLFPELTPVQFETSLLFALGCSQKEISALRSVAYRVVKQAIAEAKSKFETQSLTGLLTAFHVRLVLFALYGCKGVKPTEQQDPPTPLTQWITHAL